MTLLKNLTRKVKNCMAKVKNLMAIEKNPEIMKNSFRVKLK